MWRPRMFWRLFGAYSALTTIALALLGWFLSHRIEKHLLDEVRENLEMKTVLVRELVAGQTLGRRERQELIRRLAEETQARITLIAADGQVLADSGEDPEHMENHLNRPEVQQALEAGMGTATRFSGTVHYPLMYLAVRADLGPVRFVRLALPLSALEAEVLWVEQVVWAAAAATLVVVLLLSLLLARRLSTPLVELAQVARSVAGGAFGQRVPVSSLDEIGTLAVAFNDMSQACAIQIAKMEQDRQQLRAIFRSMEEGILVLDGAERVQFLNEAASRLLSLPVEVAQGRKLWQLLRHRQLGIAIEKTLATDEPHSCELEWSTADRKVLAVQGTRLPGQPVRGAVFVLRDISHLRKLEQVRQDFVANVSHELKTPLATIQAMVETLLDGALHDPNHNLRFLERIRENADRLHRLVQDLLTLSRIESGQEELEPEPISIQTAVEACVSRFDQLAVAKKVKLEVGPSTEPLIVLANEEALAEILSNLVDNAIKYTSPAGRVSLRWFREAEEAVLQVEDTGIGIPEKDLPRIFERFYRVDKARSRELGGTGLGLSIVKHLVQALGGSISATSRLGTGSMFTIRLPIAEVPVG